MGDGKQLRTCIAEFRPFSGRGHSLGRLIRGVDRQFNAYLARRGIRRNSVSFYMRILRAVYNKAVRKRLAEPSNPFRQVYTGIDKTRKRSIDEKMIVCLYNLALPSDTPLVLTRDLFIFSYCTRGMVFVDMAYLKKSDIQDSFIRYARHKSGQQLCIRIEPHVRQIIDRYADASAVYVFPILKTEDSAEAFAQYRIALNRYNRQLSRLSGMLHPDCGVSLSSYTARHSWVTIARQHKAPIAVISAGMGHASERTTQIYLAELENSETDAANQMIIGDM